MQLKTNILTESTKMFYLKSQETQCSESKRYMICKEQTLEIKLIVHLT